MSPERARVGDTLAAHVDACDRAGQHTTRLRRGASDYGSADRNAVLLRVSLEASDVVGEQQAHRLHLFPADLTTGQVRLHCPATEWAVAHRAAIIERVLADRGSCPVPDNVRLVLAAN